MNARYSTLRSLIRVRLCVVLLGIVASLTIVHSVEGQRFTVPGNSGTRWVNTNLDIAPGAMVYLSASGEVSIGQSAGVVGPEGTTRFASAPGYPAETSYRYGLVARLTQSRTNPNDDLFEQWSYGERHDYCAQNGGHLWLTVNDYGPSDNKGEFIVTLKLGSCSTDRGRLLSLPFAANRAHFQIVLTGFRVNHQTVDDATNFDGWGDEVYNSVTAYTINSNGRITNTSVWNSPTMGDVHSGNQVLAGTAGGTQGGLATGDSYPSSNTFEAQHPLEVAGGRPGTGIPDIIFDGILTHGENAAVIFDNLWECDNGLSPLQDAYRAMLSGNELGPSITRIIPDPRAVSVLIKPASELGLTLKVTLGDGPLGLGEVNTRPIGMIRRQPGRYVFDPKALILTYDAALRAARASDPIEIRYVDDPRLQGDYSLFFRVVLIP